MPHDDRSRDDRYEREDRERHRRMRWGENRDPYQSGNERRYLSESRRGEARGGFAGERGYDRGGYAEEFGYRRDEPPRDEGRWERDQPREAERAGPYTRFGATRFEDDERQGPGYYGTGEHYGGGFGTAPSSRASSSGSWGAPGYGGQGAFSERDEDWRETSGSRSSYSGIPFGAQSGYGRDYGQAQQGREGGAHRGRGPKGYERSDERLREMICERLTDDPRIDASDVSVEVKQRTVKLTGSVDDRRTKYLVEDVIEQCGGVQDIDNQLRVKSRTESDALTRQSSATNSLHAPDNRTNENRATNRRST